MTPQHHLPADIERTRPEGLLPLCHDPAHSRMPRAVASIGPYTLHASLSTAPCGFAARYAARGHKMRKNKRLA